MAKKSAKETPLMQQYWAHKSLHPDKIMFFRMGDFYELFHEDAVTAAPLLGIALTVRNKKSGDQTPMCGVPHHSIAGPINKLLDAGYKIALCDQVEDPKEAKGIVKREVTRILSPGVVFDPDNLDENLSNYLCSFDNKTISFLDATTGESFYIKTSDFECTKKMIDRLKPAELVVPPEFEDVAFNMKKGLEGPYISKHEFSNRVAISKKLPQSALLLSDYAVSMQGPELLKTLQAFEERALDDRIILNESTISHLEVFNTYSGEKKGSFFHAINNSKTPTGSRLLRTWIQFPLKNKESINRRLDKVENWINDTSRLKRVRESFSGMGDIERRIGKISNPNCGPRDLLTLCDSLIRGVHTSELVGENLSSKLGLLIEIISKIQNSIEEEPPVSVKQGGSIKIGVSSNLDELIKMSEDSQSLLIEMEEREKQAHSIPSLKIKYNNVFGYYIEITNKYKDKVPTHYIRKQTLVNAERYITQELQELESKVLGAKSRRIELEIEIFGGLKEYVLDQTAEIIKWSKIWGELDVVTSLAWLSLESKYVRPNLSEDGSLVLEGSRHPVIERFVGKTFVPNDIVLEPESTLLLTGPNMAGKSTLMRQVALCALLHQIGSFVPARVARMPIYDCIYTRIGASDDLSGGLSTFMVEMEETAQILKEASKRSLIILDEIGRGTSTFDGMSLAKSILEFLLKEVKAHSLFATHYHELTGVEGELNNIKNAHMSISERKGDIHFLYTLKEGPVNKSYGIQVAKLAGLPDEVIQKAYKILTDLESGAVNSQMSLFNYSTSKVQSSRETIKPTTNVLAHHLYDQLNSTQIDSMTPIEALNKLAEWKSEIQKN